MVPQPTDLVNQSLPLSYYSVSAASTDGKAHSVQVYTDISAEWVSGDNSLIANWATTTGDVITHEINLANQTQFMEINDRIQRKSHKRIYYATCSFCVQRALLSTKHSMYASRIVATH